MQEAPSHANPGPTMRRDRARTSPDRHATYIVAAFIAGSSQIIHPAPTQIQHPSALAEIADRDLNPNREPPHCR